MEDSLSIKEMCNLVSIEELAIRYGFTKNMSKSYRGGTVYEHAQGIKINISQSRKFPGQQHYSNLHDDSDGGSLYTFIKNRIRDGIISVNTSSFKENDVIAEVLRNYLNLPTQEKAYFRNNIPEKKVEAPFDFALGKMFLIPGINTTLLSNIRKISKTTFNSKLFKGTFFNCNKEIDHRRRGADLAFPCYRADGTLGGINIRYYNQHKSRCASMFMSGSEHDKSVWHSNVPDRIDQVFIGESELDCMAHYQLKPNPNTLYISHQGNLMKEQVDTIISLLRQHSDKFTSKFKMLLGADNDYQGSKYDLMLICGAAATKSGASAKCYISECATKPDYKAHMITVRQDLYEDFKNLCRRSKTSDNMTIDCYDKNNTIVITRLRGDKYSDDALSSIILESDLIKNIVKEKAMGKDWNDDLKLLTKINSKISSLKINAYMSYDLFREKYDELSLQTNSPGHLTDVISIIKDRLTPLGGLDYSQESDKTQIKKSI